MTRDLYHCTPLSLAWSRGRFSRFWGVGGVGVSANSEKRATCRVDRVGSNFNFCPLFSLKVVQALIKPLFVLYVCFTTLAPFCPALSLLLFFLHAARCMCRPACLPVLSCRGFLPGAAALHEPSARREGSPGPRPRPHPARFHHAGTCTPYAFAYLGLQGVSNISYPVVG